MHRSYFVAFAPVWANLFSGGLTTAVTTCAKGSKPYTTDTLINFDTVCSSDNQSPVPDPCQNLHFQSFRVSNKENPPPALGVRAHSTPNYIVHTIREELLEGAASITVDYPGTTAKDFTLKSFYYGCSVSLQQGTASPPQACKITATGYQDQKTGAPKAVASQSFTYQPSGQQVAGTYLQSTDETFSGSLGSKFGGLQTINFTAVALGDPALTVDLGFNFDDVSVQVHGCKN